MIDEIENYIWHGCIREVCSILNARTDLHHGRQRLVVRRAGAIVGWATCRELAEPWRVYSFLHPKTFSVSWAANSYDAFVLIRDTLEPVRDALLGSSREGIAL